MNFRTLTPARFAKTAVPAPTLPASAALAFNAGAKRNLIKCIKLANTTAAGLKFNLYVTASAAPANTDAVMFEYPVPVGGTTWTGLITVLPSENVFIGGSAVGMNVVISGAEAE